jgi:tol-pal system protein YbgF
MNSSPNCLANSSLIKPKILIGTFGRSRKLGVMLGLMLGLMTLSLPVRAGLFDDDEARKAILDIRARIETVQRETNERLSQINARLERLEQSSRGQLELANQIEQLRLEIRSLRGQLEVQTNELAELQRKQRDQLALVSDKIKQFDPVAMTVDGKSIMVEPAEKRAYDAAIATFQSGDFKGAQTSFSQFNGLYPQSKLKVNAEYWAASSIFAQKDWKTAIAQLTAFVSRNPDSPRVPDALLSIGNAQLENKERPAARKTFDLLIERHPDTPASQQARERITTLTR